MKKILDAVARDLWIVLLDILAVNASYFLALMVRFYVNFEFRPTVSYYLTNWLRITPFYTVACVIVFALFRLYGGMWRYAGINDMNRIIGANAVTAALQVAGVLLCTQLGVFVKRMPVTYHVIGAILQFLFIVLIRFSYRILLVEKQKMTAKKTHAIPAMIIGAGETGRKAVNHLEESGVFRPAVVVDSKNEIRQLNGIPVTADLDGALKDVKAVFIADPSLDAEERRAIREKTDALGLELRDYTGYLSNLSGKVPLTSLLEMTGGKVTVTVDGKETAYASGEEALRSMTGRYEVVAIRDLKAELKKTDSVGYEGYDLWAQKHKEQTGEEVSFF